MLIPIDLHFRLHFYNFHGKYWLWKKMLISTIVEGVGVAKCMFCTLIRNVDILGRFRIALMWEHGKSNEKVGMNRIHSLREKTDSWDWRWEDMWLDVFISSLVDFMHVWWCRTREKQMYGIYREAKYKWEK